MLAAKGGADPESNFKLRVAIDRARADSMPKDNIERAISKATTEAANIQEIMYEGFGPGGIGVLVEAATDNKNRTAQEMKNIFEKGGGSLGSPGAVSYNFESKGFLLVKKSSDVDSQTLSLIDMGAEDIVESEDGLEVYVAPDKLGEIKKKAEAAGLTISEMELQMKPKNLTSVSNPEEAGKAIKFLETLEEADDVQKVYSNLDIPEEVVAQI